MKEVTLTLSDMLDSITDSSELKNEILTRSDGDIVTAFSVVWGLVNSIKKKSVARTIALSAVAKIPDNIVHVVADLGTAIKYIDKESK